jgi:hypothetical protein
VTQLFEGALNGRSGVDPVLEEGDPLFWPSAVAGHRAVTEAFQYGAAVSRDVVVRPEVERPFHRVAVALSKERLDVLVEADRLVDSGHDRGRRVAD